MNIRNNTLFISILLLFILFAVIMFLKPSAFIFLFGSLLGNFLLVLAVVGFGILDIKWAIGVGALFIILYQSYHIREKEGFSDSTSTFNDESYPYYSATTWSKKTIDDFLKFQKTNNPNMRFDMDIIQQQATPAEVEILLNTGKWVWSSDVQQIYKDSIAQNTIINTDPDASMTNAQSIYNETAIKEILSWNSKEGEFLLRGAIIGNSPDVPENIHNVVRCGTNADTGEISMDKIVYTGYGNTSTVTPVSNADLPSTVAGFKFIKDECNPCLALKNPPDYSCPFALNTGNGYNVSPIWNMLWTSSSSSPQEVADDKVINLDKTQFPLLYQLKNELIKGAGLVDITFKNPSTLGLHTTSSSSGSSKAPESVSTISGSTIPANVTNDVTDKNISYIPTNMF